MEVALSADRVRDVVRRSVSLDFWMVEQDAPGLMKLRERGPVAFWHSAWRAEVRISWEEANEATTIRFDASNLGEGAPQTAHLRGLVISLKRAIRVAARRLAS